jgi:hypothetical protein
LSDSDYTVNHVESTDPATDHMLCMAVGCKAIATKSILAIVALDDGTGKEEKHKINFCQDHYLKQMAYQYEMEARRN